MSIVEETVIYLFKELEARNILIVVMRNYHNLPDIGNDLDAALKIDDIGIVREIIISDYLKHRWTEICEVKTHNSEIKEHNIYVFKFFNTEYDIYMQIDFFQGFLFKGQPFFSIKDFLNNSRQFKSFPIVSAEIEMTIKHFQIFNAICASQWDRVEKYRIQSENLIALCVNNELNFTELNQYLLSRKFEEYKNKLKQFRIKKLKLFFIKNPLGFMLNVIYRFGSFYRFFIIDPFVVYCNFAESCDKLMIENVLNNLIKQKCFRYYIVRENYNTINYIKLFLKMSQSGGVIVTYNKRGLFLNNENDIKKYIINEFVTRHNAI